VALEFPARAVTPVGEPGVVAAATGPADGAATATSAPSSRITKS